MSTLCVHLFGKCSMLWDGRPIERLDGGKPYELLCYLLLHHSRPHARERLASILWIDITTAQSKKYLRQTLWQLQAALQAAGMETDQLITADADWVRVDCGPQVWLDVGVFCDALVSTRGIPGAQLCDMHMQALRSAVQLYSGDLLEGWYYDWCLYERERLQNAYLSMLDKLMSYCEAHQQYEEGLYYGECILRYERARERTHRQLMRLYYLSGDRTSAIRQYQRCCLALHEELDVQPALQTTALFAQIRADLLDAPCESQPTSPASLRQHLPSTLNHLRQIQQTLAVVQRNVSSEIHSLESALQTQPSAVGVVQHSQLA